MSEIIPGQPFEEQPFELSDDTLKGKQYTTTRGRAAAVMFVSGADPEYIADVIGFPDADAVHKAVEKALAQSFDSWDKASLRRIVTARYETLFKEALARSRDRRNPNREAAAANAMKAVDRVVEVFGIKEPAQVVMHTATQAEIQVWINEVRQEDTAGLPQEVDVIEGHVVRDEPA